MQKLGERMNIFEIKDHNSLRIFFAENGLEVSNDIERDDGAIFSVIAQENNATIAAATLSLRQGHYILDYIATTPDSRCLGLGSKLLETIVKKVKSLGAKSLYITARNPQFFKKHGFTKGQPKNLDMNEGCIGCPQYNTTCVSVPMVLNLGENYDQN